MTTSGLARYPHHDGSSRFVLSGAAEIGSTATMLVLEPRRNTDAVRVRVVAGGYTRYLEGRRDHADTEGTWWRFDVPVEAPRMSYRFELRNAGRVDHLNGIGVDTVEPPDAADFRLQAGPRAPAWTRDAVLYQILIDRFARSEAAARSPRPGPQPVEWTDELLDHPAGATQFFGGDLDGITERIDHIAGLGATALCLTPFFPAPEYHRYCASSFDHVDPALGGDAALHRLLDALSRRGMRCIGDLTLNHTGSTHDWFRAALSSQDAPERGMYRFWAHPGHYATFQGVRSLPKLDYSAQLTHDRMYRRADSVARRWLSGSPRLDGWRVDVASMVGRLDDDDANHAVAAGFTAAVRTEHADAFVIAEIPHDPSEDVRGGWPGALLDAGFAAPVRRWLSADPAATGPQLHRGLRSFAAALPWEALTSSVGQVGSHDLPRLRSVTGSADRAGAALFLLMTFPSVPLVFAGDEFGVTGATADLARSPMPWPGTGLPADRAQLDQLTELIRMRRGSSALTGGGFRWLLATDDGIAFDRTDRAERVLCVATRQPASLVIELGCAVTEAEPLLASCPLTIAGRSAHFASQQGALCGAWRLHVKAGHPSRTSSTL